MKLDGFVKSPLCPLIVIPAKAGIQSFQVIWIPAFAGMTRFLTFYDTSILKRSSAWNLEKAVEAVQKGGKFFSVDSEIPE
jgi:hypothetical protein